MAEYGRYGDHQTRDRESSRYGRDVGDDRGGWSRGRGDEERGRGGGMFGSGSSSHGRDDERGHGRWEEERSEKGWGRSRSDEGGSSWSGSRDDDRGSSWGGSRDRDRSSSWSNDRHDEGSSGWGGGWGGSASESGRSSHGHQRGQREFGYDDRHEGLPVDETSRLIASNKVEGTAVYSRTGQRLGSIYNFMVDKRSGKVEYAVMSYGGFLGMGTRYYPMPWDLLEYDTRLGGYRVDMMERDLERAPSFDRSNEPEFDQRYGERVRGWYGLRV